MSANGLRTRSAFAAPELAVAGGLLAIAAAAWVLTVLRMSGMAAGLWSYQPDLGLYAGTWVAMITAMMLPSIVPRVLRYQRAVRSSRGGRTALQMSGVFVVGYIVVWSLAGLVPYFLLGVVGAYGLLVGGAGRYLAAGVLLAAAAYQLAPIKQACLRGLCGPLTPAWQAGQGGPNEALRAGLECGGWCLGCTWALMASLFALGLMSPTWMIVIWALVMAERLLPSPRLATVGVALVLGALAIGVAAAPTPFVS